MKNALTASVLTLAVIIAHAPSARADIWGDIGNAIGNVADAAHDVVTLGQHGRDRDAERARQEEEKVRAAREAAERSRQQEISSLQALIQQNVSHRNDLAEVVKRVETILAAQTAVGESVALIYGQQMSEADKSKIAAVQAQLGAEEMANVMAALKMMFANKSQPVSDVSSLTSYEVGIMALVELSHENNMSVEEMLLAALDRQQQLGKNIGSLLEVVQQRRSEALAFRDSMVVRLNDVKAKLNESVERLKQLDPSKVPQI